MCRGSVIRNGGLHVARTDSVRARNTHGDTGSDANCNLISADSNVRAGTDGYAAHQHPCADVHAEARADSHACRNAPADLHATAGINANADTHLRSKAN